MKSALPLALILLPILAVTVGAGGCHSLELDPAGPYAGDRILYTADQTITGAYDALDAFVRWEYQNRAALAARPEIRQAADGVRLHARQWIDSAIALREAYQAAPTEDNRIHLQGALEIIREALAQAALYMAPPPNAGPG